MTDCHNIADVADKPMSKEIESKMKDTQPIYLSDKVNDIGLEPNDLTNSTERDPVSKNMNASNSSTGSKSAKKKWK